VLHQRSAVRSAAPGAQEIEYLGWNAVRIYYNINRPPCNAVKFRRAFALAIDRDEYLKTATTSPTGGGTATTPAPPSAWVRGWSRT